MEEKKKRHRYKTKEQTEGLMTRKFIYNFKISEYNLVKWF